MALPTPDQIAPLPGSATIVKTYADKYTATAQAIEEAAAEIRRLVSNTATGDSQAVDALVEVSTDVAERLEKLHSRYSTAGSALSTYSGSLSAAKGLATTAVSTRDSALGEISVASYWARHYEDEMNAATDEAEKAEHQRHFNSWNRALEDAYDSLLLAQQTYQQAIADRDSAATLAKGLIDDAVESDGINDSAWDNFSGWVAANAEWIKILKDVLSILSTILGVLSLFFPILAPFALILAGAAALLSLLLAMTGQISWIEFGLDFLAFATLGVGAIFSAALKGTMATLKTTRIVTVASQAGSKNPLRVINGSFAGVLPSRTTLLGKLSWLWEIRSAGGVQNAVAMRILQNAKAGNGGAFDAALVTLGQMQIGVQQGANLINGLLHGANMGLENTDLIGQVSDLVFPDQVGDFVDGIGDWYEGVNDSATWRVGSNW